LDSIHCETISWYDSDFNVPPCRWRVVVVLVSREWARLSEQRMTNQVL
jgi:hypothetical protein